MSKDENSVNFLDAITRGSERFKAASKSGMGGKGINLPRPLEDTAKSDSISIHTIPSPMRSKIDELAARVLDRDNNHTVVIGSPRAGKSFIIEQFAYNINTYMKNSSEKMHFYRLTDVEIIEMNSSENINHMINLLVENSGVSIKNICFVTEKAEVALYIATLLPQVKVILESNAEDFNNIFQNANKANSKSWKTWANVDANSVYCTREETIDLLMKSIVSRLNKTNSYTISHRNVKDMINYVNLRLDGIEQEYEDELVLAVPPGIWATALRYIAMNCEMNTAHNDSSDSTSKPHFHHIMQETIIENVSLFTEADPFGDMESMSAEDFFDMLTKNGAEVVNLGNIFDRSMSTSMGETKTPEITPLEFKDVESLQNRMSKDIMGQDEALKRICENIVVSAAGLNDPRRPIRSFLFCGPTGVGKTQATIDLANEVATEKMNLVRIDMSEFMQEHEVAKLFGSPPGYVGYEQGGILTNAVLEHPHSVVLLDEIEKAHPKVWDAFLQVFDNGHMTDARGQVVDFTQTIVIMTSNLGVSEALRKRAGFGNSHGSQTVSIVKNNSDSEGAIRKKLEETFRPEFLNRLDEIIIFNSLTKEIASNIVRKEFSQISHRMSDRGYVIDELDEDVIQNILDTADVEKFGAREIQRVLLRKVSTPLAHHIIHHKNQNHLNVKLVDNAICINGDEK